MADDRSARKGGGRKPEGDSKPKSVKETMADKAKGFLAGIFENTPTDSFGERFADVAIRNQATKAGGAFAEFLLARPMTRRALLVIPEGVIEYLGPVAATYIADRYLPLSERTEEWAKEFAQGFGVRVSAESGKTATASPVGAAPAAPAGPREMSAAEVLAKRPALTQFIERTYTVPEDAQRVIARLHRFLNFEFEADLLMIPAGGPAPFDIALADNLRRRTIALVERVIPQADRPRVMAELRKRISGTADLDLLLASAGGVAILPMPAAALAAAIPTFIRLLPDDAERGAVLGRTSRFLADADLRAFLISAPSGDEAVPAAIAADPAWTEFAAIVTGVSPDEAAELIAEAAKRVTGMAQVEALTAPPPGTASITPAQLKQCILALPKRTEVLTREVLIGRLESLEQVVPAPAFAQVDVPRDVFEERLSALPERIVDIDRAVFERRLVLIEDAHATRHLSGPLKSGLERLTAIGHSFFGGTEQVGGFVDEGTAFFDGLNESFFGNNNQGGGT
ncbi:MAG: hypothetical protein AAB974_00605 [Patescibacteria group bacterium]